MLVSSFQMHFKHPALVLSSSHDDWFWYHTCVWMIRQGPPPVIPGGHVSPAGLSGCIWQPKRALLFWSGANPMAAARCQLPLGLAQPLTGSKYSLSHGLKHRRPWHLLTDLPAYLHRFLNVLEGGGGGRKLWLYYTAQWCWVLWDVSCHPWGEGSRLPPEQPRAKPWLWQVYCGLDKAWSLALQIRNFIFLESKFIFLGQAA